MNELPKILPVPILLTTYNRIELLKKTIDFINERTFFPYRIFVGDNNSSDGTQGYLKWAKTTGKIYEYLFMNENVGQSKMLNQLFALVEDYENNRRRPMHRYFCTTNDDLYPPFLGNNCWLTRMVDILERHEPEYGGICGRIQRMSRADIDESKEIIPAFKGFPSVYRLLIREDFRKLGEQMFGFLRKWDSNSCADKLKFQLCKRFGFTTHIYFNHAGFMEERKGYGKEVDTFTVAENKLNEMNDKPYPDINPDTNVPVKINHPCDAKEMELREQVKLKKEVTLIILTHRRPNGLKRIVDSIRQYTTDVPYDLLIVIDNDDVESYQWCVENNIKCLLSSYHRDFTAQANLGIFACETPYFVLLADDMEIIESEWLAKALKIFKEKFPDGIGIMTFQEGLQNGRIFTTGMSSKKFINFAGGCFFYPLYKHYGGDNELSFWTKHLGKYHYAEEIRVNHFHPTHKVPEMAVADDETYQISQKFMHQDQKLKKERKADLEKLIKDKNYYDYF